MSFLPIFCLNAVKLIIISQMKSSGIICSSPQLPEGQHAFLFSLRALDSSLSRKFDISLEIPAQANQCTPASECSKATPASTIDLSALLPCFSKDSEPRLSASAGLSPQETFQKENRDRESPLNGEGQGSGAEGSQIMEARPRSNYCQICKETFSDYLKHLTHPLHVRKFEAQSRSTMIDQLIKGVSSGSSLRGRARRGPVDDQDGECRLPCKVRVIQMQDTLTPMRVSSAQSNNCSSAYKSSVAR